MGKLGERLSETIWHGPAETLTLTENAQPALYVTSIAALKCFEALCSRGPDATAAADKDDDLPQPVGGRPDRRRAPLQHRGQGLAGRRLHQVVAGAGREQVAEQRDVVDRAEHNEFQIGATDRARALDLSEHRRQMMLACVRLPIRRTT